MGFHVVVLISMMTIGLLASSTIIYKVNEINSKCKMLGNCNAVKKEYPTELAKKLIKELKEQGAVFASEEMPVEEEEEEFSEGGFIKLRFGEENEENISVCESNVTYEIPRYLYDENGINRTILNDKENPVIYRREICLSKTCSDKMKIQSNYKCECHTCVGPRELYQINDDNTTSLGNFPIDYCCGFKIVHVK